MSWRLLVLLVLLVAAAFAGDETTTAAAPPAEPSDDVLIWGLNHNNSVLLRSILAATCVILAGMVSGLTLSIFSITKEELESMVMTPHTASRAKRLLRLHHHEHWVLVTLLVCNAASVEALPLLLEPLLDISHIVQVLVPTLLVLFFSEIIPQSIFVRYAFAVSAALIPFVMIMMVVTMPISLTVGYLLDKIVGHRSLRSFRRMELKQLVYENLARSGLLHSVGNTSSHRRSLMSRASGVGGATWGDHNATGDLTMDEARLILGALSISETRVGERMKPLGDCLWVTPETQFSPPVVEALARAGYSRIPVLNRAAGEGARPALLSKPTADERVSSIGEGRAAKTSQPTFILTKDLIRLVHHLPGSSYSTPADFAHYQTVACRVDDCVLDLYLKFLAQKRHLAIVANDDGEPVGLITYSDVIGILTQTQFLDESDLTRDLPAQVRIRRHHHHAAYSDSPGRGSTVRTTAQHSTGGSPTGRAARDSAHSSAPVGERTALLSAPHKTVSPPPSQPSTSSKRTRSNMV